MKYLIDTHIFFGLFSHRKKYGFESGQRIRIFPGAEGVTLVPERSHRRFVKCGPILTIDTGVETAPMEAFDVSALRKDHLNGKGNENRR